MSIGALILRIMRAWVWVSCLTDGVTHPSGRFWLLNLALVPLMPFIMTCSPHPGGTRSRTVFIVVPSIFFARHSPPAWCLPMISASGHEPRDFVVPCRHVVLVDHSAFFIDDGVPDIGPAWDRASVKGMCDLGCPVLQSHHEWDSGIYPT